MYYYIPYPHAKICVICVICERNFTPPYISAENAALQVISLAESADFADFNNYALLLYIELTFMYYYIPYPHAKICVICVICERNFTPPYISAENAALQVISLAESAESADFNNYALFLYIELTFMYYYIPLSARKNLRYLRHLREKFHTTIYIGRERSPTSNISRRIRRIRRF